jgi:hypothetical protein
MGRHKYILALVISLSIFNIAFHLYAYRNGILWDLAVYQTAVENIENNSNPYATGQGLLFIYHPIVLGLFRILAQINLSIGLGLFYLISVLFIYLSLGHKYSKELLLSISFGGLGLTSFATGNVTTFLHLFLLALLLKGVRNDNYYLSYPIIILFSLIKPYFLAYIFVPIFVNQSDLKKQIKLCLLFIATYVAIIILYHVVNPDIAGKFYAALHYQTLAKGDIGYSFFFWASKLTHSDLISIILHSIFSIALIVSFYFFRLRWFGKNLSKTNALFMTYFVLTIINPRMKEYDLFPALLSLFIFGKNVLGEKFLKYYLASLTVVSVPLLVQILTQLWGLSPSIYLTNYWLWQWGSIVVFLAAIFLNKRFINMRLSNLSAY